MTFRNQSLSFPHQMNEFLCILLLVSSWNIPKWHFINNYNSNDWETGVRKRNYMFMCDKFIQRALRWLRVGHLLRWKSLWEGLLWLLLWPNLWRLAFPKYRRLCCTWYHTRPPSNIINKLNIMVNLSHCLSPYMHR